jgi:hypothetical protein
MNPSWIYQSDIPIISSEIDKKIIQCFFWRLWFTSSWSTLDVWEGRPILVEIHQVLELGFLTGRQLAHSCAKDNFPSKNTSKDPWLYFRNCMPAKILLMWKSYTLNKYKRRFTANLQCGTKNTNSIRQQTSLNTIPEAISRLLIKEYSVY